MNNEKGFTLVEMLIVLSLLTVIVSISVYLSLDFLNKQQEKHFFELLHSDIFFVQNQSFSTLNKASIMFRDGYYVVYKTSKDRNPLIREYPNHISFYHYENNTISFLNQGDINPPISIRFNKNGENYKLVFPFGKGRAYIE